MTNQSKPGKAGLNVIWETRKLKDLDRIDGEPMEFEWKNFTGFTTLGILGEIQTFVIESQREPEQFKGRIILMSMYKGIDWRERGNIEKYNINSFTVANYARRFPVGRCHFRDLDQRRNGTGLILINQVENETRPLNE